MFKAKISDSKLFKTIFTTLSYIIDEAELKIDSEGIRLITLDREHITFVGLEMKAELFDDFICDEPLTLSLDLFNFMKALDLVSKDDSITLSCNEYRAIIVFESEYQSKFEIGLIEIENDTPEPPELEYDVNLEIESKTLNEMFKKVHKISEKEVTGTLKVDQDYLRISGGSDFIKSEFKYLHGQKVTNDIKTMFTLEKMINIMKAATLTDIIYLKLGNAFPINIKFIPTSENFSLEFLLAPRISKDEGE